MLPPSLDKLSLIWSACRARRETDNWALARQRVEETGLELSMAGVCILRTNPIRASVLMLVLLLAWTRRHAQHHRLDRPGMGRRLPLGGFARHALEQLKQG